MFLTGTYNYKKYNFRLRLQFQRKNGVGNHDLIIKDFFRTKFELTRDIIDWKADPTIGIELFTKEDLNFDENFKKYRFSVGTKLNLNELNSLSINYVFQKEVKVDYPFLQHILSLNYNFSFERDLSFSNYDEITAIIGSNKLNSKFDYITENHELGNSELISNNTEIKFTKEHSLKFDTTK